MKITFITGYFYPEQCADTRLNLDLVQSLVGYGCEVTVITPFPTRGVEKDVQATYIKKLDEQINDNLRIIRVGGPARYKQNIIRRGLVLLKKTYEMYDVAKSIETDVYIVVSTPPFLGYAAALLEKKAPVIYKLEDIFPDSLKYSMNLNEYNPLVYILRKFEKWVYKRVSSIVVISDDMRRTIVEHGADAEKISTIYDWIDEEACYPVCREENYLFDKFGLSRDDFYVCYAGNIGLLQNVQTIIRASEILAKKCPKIKFVIVGDGAWTEKMIEMLRVAESQNVFYFPMQPTDQIAFVYSFGDVGIVSLKPDVTKYALPSKTWDIMSAGRAAICEIDLYSTLCDIVERNECGYCVEPGDAYAMADKIEFLFKHPDLCLRAGNNGRIYIKNNMTRTSTTRKYYDLMGSILN